MLDELRGKHLQELKKINRKRSTHREVKQGDREVFNKIAFHLFDLKHLQVSLHLTLSGLINYNKLLNEKTLRVIDYSAAPDPVLS